MTTSSHSPYDAERERLEAERKRDEEIAQQRKQAHDDMVARQHQTQLKADIEHLEQLLGRQQRDLRALEQEMRDFMRLHDEAGHSKREARTSETANTRTREEEGLKLREVKTKLSDEQKKEHDAEATVREEERKLHEMKDELENDRKQIHTLESDLEEESRTLQLLEERSRRGSDEARTIEQKERNTSLKLSELTERRNTIQHEIETTQRQLEGKKRELTR